MVLKEWFDACGAAVAVSALNRVDLPTLERPRMPHLKPMKRLFNGMAFEEKSSCSRLLARCIRLFCIEKTFDLHGEMHPVLKARVLSFAQEIDVVRDDPAQSLDPWPLVLGKVAEHVSVHEILHPGMADPDAHAAIVVAHMRRDRA